MWRMAAMLGCMVCVSRMGRLLEMERYLGPFRRLSYGSVGDLGAGRDSGRQRKGMYKKQAPARIVQVPAPQ